MLKTKAIITYFRHNSLYFLSFQNSRQMYSGGQGGGRQGGGRQGGGRQGGGRQGGGRQGGGRQGGGRQGGGRQGGGRQGGGRQGGGGVSHIGAGIILSISCLPCLVLFYVWSWKFLLFQFMVQNLREVSVHHIIIFPVKFRKICIEKYMKMSLIH